MKGAVPGDGREHYRQVFEAYLEYVLAPALKEGQRVMDNLR
jgi:hypothetical protein